MFAVKIDPLEITWGPKTFEVEEEQARAYASVLVDMGYRKTSNAYCCITRIDREDWLDYLAIRMKTSVANFYNKDGSGVSDRWRDHYIRVYSNDQLTISPAIYRFMIGY